MIDHFPVFAVCGYSGSGKTTLIESLVRHFEGRGIRTGIIKHDAHGPRVDVPGKDSDRFFQAGADVLLHGPTERFLRVHDRGDSAELSAVLAEICPRYDLVLVEGHKTTPMPRKMWLLSAGEREPPAEAGVLQAVLGRDDDRFAAALGIIEPALQELWLSVPVRAGILTGGQATRMGRPKHLIRMAGETWIERIARVLRSCTQDVFILGQVEVPPALQTVACLPDAPGRRGPLAGMLAAMRWDPFCSWVFVACDMPMVTPEAVGWLLSTRRPGVWATMPRLGPAERVEPLLAHYDFRARRILEPCTGPAEIAGHPKVATLPVPAALAGAWANLNTPQDVARATGDAR